MFGKKTSNVPDFAFPQQVMAEAGKALDRSLKQGKYVDALRAAMDLSISRDLISNDSVPENLQLLESLAATLPDPYSRVAKMMQATLYKSVYSEMPWVFAERRLPPDSVPEDVMAWDSDLFISKITDLVSDASRNLPEVSGVWLSDMASLFEPATDLSEWSLADFIAFQGSELVNSFYQMGGNAVIPFDGMVAGQTPSERASQLSRNLRKEIYDLNLSLGREKVAAYAARELMSSLRAPKWADFLEQALLHFEQTPYAAELLRMWVDNQPDAEKLAVYERISTYIDKFPNAPGIADLKNMQASFLTKSVAFNVPSTILPNREREIKVSCRNMRKGYILVVSVNSNDGMVSGRDFSRGSLVAAIPFEGNKEKVVLDTVSVNLPPLSPGFYCLAASTSANMRGILGSGYRDILQVSEIQLLTLPNPDGSVTVYVVNGENQKPIAGAEVRVSPMKDRNSFLPSEKFSSDKDGAVIIPKSVFAKSVFSNMVKVEALYRGSWLTETVNSSYSRVDPDNIEGNVFTDLSVYRPGKEMQYAAVLYSRKGKTLAPAPDVDVAVEIRFPNGETVQVDTLRSGSDGRISGRFTLPDSGMLGRCSLAIYAVSSDNNGSGSRNYLGAASFRVEEYKMPGFLVTLEREGENADPSKEVVFKGLARTYSGMPVSDASVSFTVNWSPWPRYWGMGGSESSYTSNVQADSEGAFRIVLPTANLAGTVYEKGIYTLKATVTDQAGETQSSSEEIFVLGDNPYKLAPSIPDRIDLSGKDSLRIEAPVLDVAGRPVVKTVFYRLTDDEGKEMASGNFQSPLLILPAKNIPSGRYHLDLSLEDNLSDLSNVSADENETSAFIVYRNSDKRPPAETVLWVEDSRIVVPAGETKCKVRVGSSYPDSWILAVISDSKKIISQQWLVVSDGFGNLNVPAPDKNERIFVEFIGCHDFRSDRQRVTLIPAAQLERLSFTQRSFRPSIEPGSEEKWSFNLEIDGKPLGNAPVMAVMSNRALDVIAPFSWSFNPYAYTQWSPSASVSFNYVRNISFRDNSSPTYLKTDSKPFYCPDWQTYGYPWTGGMSYDKFGADYAVAFSAGGASGDAAPPMMMSESANFATMKNSALSGSVRIRGGALKEEAFDEEMELDEGAVTGAGEASDSPDVEMRNVDVPLAFFQPDLKTDAAGIVDIDFTMPQAIGSWQLQLLGYAPDMKGTVATFEIKSGRKVMAQLNAPRFLRTGDQVSIAATLYNNSTDSLPIAGRIELVDALTDRVIAFKDFPASEVDPSRSRVVSAEFSVGDQTSVVYIRAYALAANSSDGEQTLIPVLPSSQPVIEARTFFLAPGEQTLSVKLPSFNKEATVTLQYCSNPAWTALTQLPSLLVPSSTSTLANVSALYGNAVAAGLLSSRPQLAEGLREFLSPDNSGDSTLVSRLERNGELKTVALNNTPWTDNAASQTLRMESLARYLEKWAAAKAVDEVVSTLVKTQGFDGGWSWCPGMKSSRYITGRALLYFSMLRQLGYFPASLEEPSKKAVNFFDSELIADWKQAKRPQPSAADAADILYVRSGFPAVPLSKEMKEWRSMAIKQIRNNWKRLDIYHKAVTAIVLHREGNASDAYAVLESLRQYASVTEERGMWFDNLRDSWTAFNPLITTTQVLEAFAEISPAGKEVDLLRQSILLAGVSEEWGDVREAVEVVNAILRSGSDWISATAIPEIKIGGETVRPDRIAKLTGEFKMTIPVKEADKALLEVKKDGASPSWGGIVAKYVAPIKTIKDDGDSHIRIEKAVYLLDGENGVAKASTNRLKVGDRVRVTLTLRTDRDMEYVAITDARAACLEPADKRSSYSLNDGIWMYREIRDASTNLFIEYLPKGTHVISYDCFIDRVGEFALGIATAQSQLAPTFSAHSAGKELLIRE